jgi:glycerophosphoryl diester phosphodiesterase
MGSRAKAAGSAPRRRTEAVAHRGVSAHAPENTIAAFDLAITMGADGIETDLRVTRDGVVVLLHDTTVDRSTDGRGAVEALTFRQVHALDAGRWFDRRFAGLRVPDLGSFLRRYGRSTRLELEFKVAAAVDPAVEAVGRNAAAPAVVFTSFEYSLLETVRRRAPWAHVGWLVPQVTPDAVAALSALSGVQICPPASGLTGEDVDLAHRAGLRVRVWGIADRLDAHRVAECGADGATVDCPDWLNGTPVSRHC